MTRTYDLLEEGLEHAMPSQISIERFLKQIKFLIVATRESSSKQINLAPKERIRKKINKALTPPLLLLLEKK